MGEMMKQVLVCSKCHADLTRDLIFKYGSVDPSWDKDSFPPSAIEEGVAVQLKPVKYFSPQDDIETLSVIWLNLNDVLDHVTCFGTDVGCCGKRGTMPNRACSCGSGIGSEFSDCYGKHRFEPNPKTTFWMEFIPHNKTRERKRIERLELDRKSLVLIERDRLKKY